MSTRDTAYRAHQLAPGAIYGRLRVIEHNIERDGGFALVLCDPVHGGCGRELLIRAADMVRDTATSCGCLGREQRRRDMTGEAGDATRAKAVAARAAKRAEGQAPAPAHVADEARVARDREAVARARVHAEIQRVSKHVLAANELRAIFADGEPRALTEVAQALEASPQATLGRLQRATKLVERTDDGRWRRVHGRPR